MPTQTKANAGTKCPQCDGEGKITCQICRGRKQQQKCAVCDGTGKEACLLCAGTGQVKIQSVGF